MRHDITLITTFLVVLTAMAVIVQSHDGGLLVLGQLLPIGERPGWIIAERNRRVRRYYHHLRNDWFGPPAAVGPLIGPVIGPAAVGPVVGPVIGQVIGSVVVPGGGVTSRAGYCAPYQAFCDDNRQLHCCNSICLGFRCRL
ncbi:hypothetical protein BV898_12211 [Hypsibius exemplaris]|uniref:WAP domain-containing protein n=1 Tax=Hypsibius exemplaris TaxID=2072580 RepID=A0A1W0WED7_HYPEX|nr:hypothetical protein BV898_12211 [Hypsibius exemplaris]